MAMPVALAPVSVQEFLEGEMLTEKKHELSYGTVYAMAGASKVHVAIYSSVHGQCYGALQGKTCRFLGQDTKIVVQDTGSVFYPDGVIACPPKWVDTEAGAVDNPTVIFEILSPSTEAKDRGEKFQNYALLPSLQDYVLINTRHERVEVFSRREDGSWLLRIYIKGATVWIPSVELELQMDKIYEDAQLETLPISSDEPSVQ